MVKSVLIACVAVFALSACGANTIEKETAIKACREYTNIWGVSGRYVTYNSFGDWFMCYSQSGDELRLFDGDFIRERMKD